jgi:hypothetical protein
MIDTCQYGNKAMLWVQGKNFSKGASIYAAFATDLKDGKLSTGCFFTITQNTK